MSVSRTERNVQSHTPYERLNSKIVEILPNIETRLVAAARHWDTSTIVQDDLVGILAKIEELNRNLGRLVGVISQNPNPSTSTFASTSEISTPSLRAYNSPSGKVIFTTRVQPMLVDRVSSLPLHDFSIPTLGDAPDVIMEDVEATESAARSILYQAEKLLVLSRLYIRPTMRKFNSFNQRTTGLDNLMPMIYGLTLSGRFLLVIKDLAGRGWCLSLADIAPLDSEGDDSNHPSWPSPMSLLATRVVDSLVVQHNARALNVVHRDVTLQNKMRLLEPCSIKILKGVLYLVEGGLLESRLNIHTFVREHMILKVAHGSLWFQKTISAYDTEAERKVTMPSLGDIIRGTVIGRSAIEDLVRKPFGEDGNGGLFGEINTLVTLISTGLYFAEGGIAYQACLLESKYPGITGEKGKRPFIDFFPLSAFCMVLAFVLVVLQEISLHTTVYIDSNDEIDFDTVPTLDELMTFMDPNDRMEPIGKRAMFLALYDALLPHGAKVLEPLNRQANSRSAVWVERFSPVDPDMD